MQITTFSVDLAKNKFPKNQFQAHGFEAHFDAHGEKRQCRTLKRARRG